MNGTKRYPYTEEKLNELLRDRTISDPVGLFVNIRDTFCVIIGINDGFYDILPVNCTNCKDYQQLNFLNAVCLQTEATMYGQVRKISTYETVSCPLYETFSLEK